MASKKKKEAIPVQPSKAHPIQDVYSLMIMMGIIDQPGDVVTGYTLKNSTIQVAIPKIKFGLAFEDDTIEDFVNDEWRIESVTEKDIEAFSRIYFSVNNARVSKQFSQADPTVKNTSHVEDILLAALIQRGIEEPQRNLKFQRDDGSELTVPDFAWENEEVAFFMDGAYWHSIKGDQDVIKNIKESDELQKKIVGKRADKHWKDQDIRSGLAEQGWLVLSCTDADIMDDKRKPDHAGIKKQVDRIEKTLLRRRSQNEVKSLGVDQDTQNELGDLLTNG